jgi:hypothetical protein
MLMALAAMGQQCGTTRPQGASTRWWSSWARSHPLELMCTAMQVRRAVQLRRYAGQQGAVWSWAAGSGTVMQVCKPAGQYRYAGAQAAGQYSYPGTPASMSVQLCRYAGQHSSQVREPARQFRCCWRAAAPRWVWIDVRGFPSDVPPHTNRCIAVAVGGTERLLLVLPTPTTCFY